MVEMGVVGRTDSGAYRPSLEIPEGGGSRPPSVPSFQYGGQPPCILGLSCADAKIRGGKGCRGSQRGGCQDCRCYWGHIADHRPNGIDVGASHHDPFY